MELWFILAVGASITAGFAAFTVKVVAKREYNSELYIFNSAIGALLLSVLIAIAIFGFSNLHWFAILIAFIGGALASFSQILKVYALRYIDTTIYFPLFKVISPLIAIIFGLMFFGEVFSAPEWAGLILGLLVPLLLITKAEHRRQNNLIRGLVLVLVTGVISAIVAGFNKYATGLSSDVFWLMASASLGVLLGSLAIIIHKKGLHNLLETIKGESSRGLVAASALRAVFITVSFGLTLYSFSLGGPLGIVYTIHSLYILIPIVFSIIFYKEHWNLQKIGAIILSVVALALLG